MATTANESAGPGTRAGNCPQSGTGAGRLWSVWRRVVCGDEVIFSEVSPRPHDTGMVTLISQDLSEFALHVRAFLGLPVGAIRQYGPAASAVILPQLTSQNITFDNVQNAVGAGLQIRLFGKPEIDGSRRLGVALATAESVNEAIERAKLAAGQVKVQG